MSSSSTEERRTTTTTKKGGYKSKMAPRTTVIQRHSSAGPMMGGYGGGGGSRSMSVRMSTGGAPLASGTYNQLTNENIKCAVTGREGEKKEMRGLNDRLAGHLERTRFLSAQNEQLLAEIERLKKCKTFDADKLKDMYDAELNEARTCINDMGKSKSELDAQIATMEEDLEDEQALRKEAERRADDLKAQLDKYINQIANLEGELKAKQMTNDNLGKENQHLRDQVERLKADNKRQRADLEVETTAHLNAANCLQTLEEELAFKCECYQTEIDELKGLINTDVHTEMADKWSGEMKNAIRDIQAEYDKQCDIIKSEMEARYDSQLRDIRQGATRDNVDSVSTKEENKKLKTQISDLKSRFAALQDENARLLSNEKNLKNRIAELERELEECTRTHSEEMAKIRGELEDVLAQMQTLMTTKMSLELEIACYRGLLEGEENRTSLRDVVQTEGNMRSESGQRLADMMASSSAQSPTANFESSARMTVQRKSKGPIGITEVNQKGECVIIENTGTGTRKKPQNMKGWTLQRAIEKNGKMSVTQTYRFTDNVDLNPNSQMTIWAKGAAPSRRDKERDFVCDFMNWGSGSCLYTLLDDEENEKASVTCRYI